MTDNTSSGPSGPPWSVDVLADLHAGALDPERSAALWPQVNADPEARAVIEALDTVKVELGQLGGAAPEPMPAHFAARLNAALAAEARRTAAPAPAVALPPPAAPAGPVIDLAAARRRRNRVMAWGAGVLTAAAAALAVIVVSFQGSDPTGGNPIAQPGAGQSGDAARPPLTVDPNNPSAAIGDVRDERDYGPLENQQRLDECIKANGLDPQKNETIGVRQVRMDGKQGVFALLTAGQPGKFQLLIVGPTCGPGDPATMAKTLFPN